MISQIGTLDTLDSVSQLLTDLGHIVSAQHANPVIATENLYMLFDAISAALAYESTNARHLPS